jgi:transcriptional regulator with XRE-family HTH domain
MCNWIILFPFMIRPMGRPAKTDAPAYGKFLADLRTASGLSQQQVAEKVGVRQSTVATWERSPRPPKGDLLPGLAKVLGVDLQTLIQCDELKTTTIRRGPISRFEKLVEEATKLPRRRQQRIADTLEALIAQEAKAS